MKVLIFATYYYPHIGGYEKDIHKLAKNLVQKGHEVYVLVCNTELASVGEIKDGVGIWRVPAWNSPVGAIPKLSKELIAFLRHMNFDVVMIQAGFPVISLLGMAFAKVKKTQFVHVKRSHVVVMNKLL